MIGVRFLLRDKHSKIKSTIRVSISFDGKRVLFCPGYSINPQLWDFKNGFPKSIRGNNELNSITNSLKELELKIRKLYGELTQNGQQSIDPDFFRAKVLQIANPDKSVEELEKKVYLLDFIDSFIEDTEKGKRLKDNEYKIESNTIKTYRSTRNHILGYQEKKGKKFLLGEIGQGFHDGFSDYLTLEMNLSKNTHSKYLMVLLQILKSAAKKKLISLSQLNDIEFNTKREETDSIYLNEQELQVLSNFSDFKSKLEEHVRDIFLLGCYTGLRFSNYSNLNLDHINEGILTVVQLKTKHKIAIPIHENVRMIIDKYNGNLPKSPTNQEFNRTLKDIGKRITELHVPFIRQITRRRTKQVEETMKWEKLTTHTARRSFCTNMYLMGLPVPTIMSVSGHKTEKSFRSYIKASSFEHAQIMKNYWEKNPSGSTVTSAHGFAHG